MKLTREFLGQVFARTHGRCWYCGVEIHPFSDWQIDHQDPVAQGGSDDPSNLVPSCRRCNGQKGNRTVAEYERFLLVKLCGLMTAAHDFCKPLQGGDIGAVQDCLLEALRLLNGATLVFYGDGRPLERTATPTAETATETVQ